MSTSSVRCLQCKDAKIRCDKRKPSCSACVRKKSECWYVGDQQVLPSAKATQQEASFVLKELCFVGQLFGNFEMFLLQTYMSECRYAMRSPMHFIKEAILRGGVSATSITPRLAASHATAWAAISMGAVLRRNENADVYLGHAIEAARLCYDVACFHTLTAMIAITHVAFFMERVELLSLFAAYVEILGAELPANKVTDIQVHNISLFLHISSSGKKTIRIREDHQVDRAALTPAQALSLVAFESVAKAIETGPFVSPLTIEQATVVKEQIQELERSLAVVLRNRVMGDHAEIHLGLTQLFFRNFWVGETNKLTLLAKQVVEISCRHPLRLHTRHWHLLAIAFSRYLLRCGEIEAAAKMWDHLNRFRPLNVGLLGPLASHTDAGTHVGEGVWVKDQLCNSFFHGQTLEG